MLAFTMIVLSAVHRTLPWTCAALLIGVIACIIFIYALSCWTFRIVPNILLGIEAFLLYAICISLPLGSKVIFGAGKIPQNLFWLGVNKSWAIYVGMGTAFITPFYKKISEILATRIGTIKKDEVPPKRDRFFTDRYKLLDKAGHFSVRSSILWGFFIPIVIVLVLLVFLKEENVQSFWYAVFGLGLISASIGYFWLLVSPENILKAENKYIQLYKRSVYKRLQKAVGTCCAIENEPSADNIVTNYYQVLSNIYCDTSSNYSDNHKYHNWKYLLSIYPDWDEAPSSEGLSIWHISELIFHQSHQFDICRSGLPKEESSDTQQQFAEALLYYLDYYWSNYPPTKPSPEQKFTYDICYCFSRIVLLFLNTVVAGQPRCFAIDHIGDEKELPFREKAIILLQYFRNEVIERELTSPYCRIKQLCFGRDGNGKYSKLLAEERLVRMIIQLPSDMKRTISNLIEQKESFHNERWNRAVESFFATLIKEIETWEYLKEFNGSLRSKLEQECLNAVKRFDKLDSLPVETEQEMAEAKVYIFQSQPPAKQGGLISDIINNIRKK